jgi:2'-5' RNA ligase
MRCFVAIDLPDEVLARLEALQARLASGVSSARWTPTEQIHLTVKFLGDVPESVLPDVCDAVSQIAERIASFDLEIRGAGVFPPHGQVNIVWAGFAAVPPALLDCQSALEQALAPLGFPPEQRSYHPHLTLARVRDRRDAPALRAAVRGELNFGGGIFAVEQLVLYESIRDQRGPRYVALHTAGLGGASG